MLFFIFTIINGVISYFVYYKESVEYMSKELSLLSHRYNIVSNELKKRSDIYFDEVVNREDILQKLRNIEAVENREEIRKELVKNFSPIYQRMRAKNVRQFHFHTKDNFSFLRVHSSDYYDDNLEDIRYSVVATNKLIKSHHGFEEGRVYNGFRNVYPLVYRGEHYGSVEISFSFKEVSETLKSIFQDEYTFIIRKDLVDEKSYMPTKNYKVSSLNSNFYVEKSYINSRILENREFYNISEKINREIKESIVTELESMKSFSVTTSYDDIDYLLLFLPIKNIEGNQVGYIVSYSQDKYLSSEFNKFVAYTIIGTAIIFLLIYAVIIHVRKEELKFINKILDNQNSLIMVKDDKQVIKVNQRLLEFFGYVSFQELLESDDCICDFFIQEEGYIFKNFKDNNHIIKYILANPDVNHRVKIVENSTKIVRVFSINVAYLDEQNLYLLILSDITSNELEKRAIEDKANRDKLTNQYNKHKFETDIKEYVFKNKIFSLILIDIDNFKDINDVNGHLAGDKILIEFGEVIDNKVRRSDFVYRWGGEEFVVLVEDRMIGATKLAEKLRFIVESHRFFKDIHVTASFGITEYRKFESVDEIVGRVDKALYTAKLSGRNCVITC
jgi:diguanylate cyclase (GGDEF)-like protein